MTELYTSGTWKPVAGHERAFVDAWCEFAAWASAMPGAGALRLTRDDHGVRFVSFGAWEGVGAVRAWKSAPEFRERMARVLQHVDEFAPAELELVATAESGAAALAAAARGAGELVPAV